MSLPLVSIQCFSDHIDFFLRSFFKESLYLIAGRSVILLPIHGVHSVILFIQSFFILDIFAARLNLLIAVFPLDPLLSISLGAIRWLSCRSVCFRELLAPRFFKVCI